MTQEIHGRTQKTLLTVQFEAVFLKVAKDLLQMVYILLRRGGGNEDVIHVDHDKVQPSHYPVHELLEGLGHVAEAEVH